MPHAKEAGFILAIDQASNAAGVSLWRDGSLVATTVLKSDSPKDGFGKRLVAQIKQLDTFLDEHLTEPLKLVLFEGVKSSHVLTTVGAFCCCKHLVDCKFSPRNNFVSALTWKRWARDRGATGKFGDIKGHKALTEVGWKNAPASHDICDSIMIYLAWRDYK